MSRARCAALIAVAALTALNLSACHSREDPDPRTALRLVEVAEVRAAGDAEHTYTGVVAARVQSDLGFRVPGKIIARLVDTGQLVRRGQRLMRIDATDYTHAITARTGDVAAARARWVQAAADEQRYRGLVESGAKQIVLYGPPGTGKTYNAREFAGTLIRQHLLKLWGPRRFFSAPESQITDLISARTHRVQFHPGYGYEDFVRGLQIGSNGQTVYRDGVLLRIVEAMKLEAGEDRKVPVVLILDEMNRADLSKVLGECFSLLEDRDTDVRLGGHDDKPRLIRLPQNLYMVGTMNLIDQSLEHVDFALRRRFLWFFRGFSREDFLAVSKVRWNRLVESGEIRRDWEKGAAEFWILADRAVRLNDIIEASSYLGSQYQIGHTYFCDVVAFTHRYLASSEKRRNRVLFSAGGAALDPVKTLWRYSLSPLIEQYLSGIDSAERDDVLKRAEAVMTAAEP